MPFIPLSALCRREGEGLFLSKVSQPFDQDVGIGNGLF